jgi:hypothetical protein
VFVCHLSPVTYLLDAILAINICLNAANTSGVASVVSHAGRAAKRCLTTSRFASTHHAVNLGYSAREIPVLGIQLTINVIQTRRELGEMGA